VTWPFAARSTVRHLEVQNELLASDRDYWKKRAEQLIDAALARAGAIHQPTMEQRPREHVKSAMAMLTSALSVTEIDSSQKRKAEH
jgi:hypothetical protein